MISVSITPEVTQKKVIFLGDSITQGGAQPGGYIDMLKEELRKKGLDQKYELIGKGIGGNRIRELLARLEKDVISQKPDVVFIMVGINDVGFFTWHPEDGGTPVDQYELGLTYMAKRIRQKGGEVVLCTPTVIEERHDGKNPLDGQLDAYSEIVGKVAKNTGSKLCDTRKAFIAYLKKYNQENKPKDILTTDYVHLNEKGNRLVMETMLPFLK
jgi:lysophospholipase L1-like esterase